eukprot:Clim_evm29s224 gene=Clim_evmTU29s224
MSQLVNVGGGRQPSPGPTNREMRTPKISPVLFVAYTVKSARTVTVVSANGRRKQNANPGGQEHDSLTGMNWDAPLTATILMTPRHMMIVPHKPFDVKAFSERAQVTTAEKRFVLRYAIHSEQWIQYEMIDKVELKKDPSPKGFVLQVDTKNFRSMVFVIPKEYEAKDLADTLKRLSRPNQLQDLYAFAHQQQFGQGSAGGAAPHDLTVPGPAQTLPSHVNPSNKLHHSHSTGSINDMDMGDMSPRGRSAGGTLMDSGSQTIGSRIRPGWRIYDPEKEYRRMGLPNDSWRLSKINNIYEICPTYPDVLAFPAEAADDVVRACAKFRSKGRLPSLVYYLPRNRSAMVRCAQPLSGIQAKRSKDDEDMISMMFVANDRENDRLQTDSADGVNLLMKNRNRHYIFDARPRINAIANRATGAGYESEENYPGCTYEFLNIENIHVVRESLYKHLEALRSSELVSNSKYQQKLYNSGWSTHLKSIMDGTKRVVQALVDEKATVIVHCSDGWDRTAQLCALAELLIDPYFRTIRGFCILVEKEWLSFGHKFLQRGGMLGKHLKEASPIFLQFLQCVHHVIAQFPTTFEFTDRLLIAIYDELCSCRFGTFLGDSERQRMARRLNLETESLWTYIEHTRADYLNPLWAGKDDPAAHNAGDRGTYPSVLDVSSHPRVFDVWQDMFCRWEPRLMPRMDMLEELHIRHEMAQQQKAHWLYLLGQKHQLMKHAVALAYQGKGAEAQKIMQEILDHAQQFASPDHVSNSNGEVHVPSTVTAGTVPGTGRDVSPGKRRFSTDLSRVSALESLCILEECLDRVAYGQDVIPDQAWAHIMTGGQLLEPPVWQDSKMPCHACQRTFISPRLPHFCRNCGQSVCTECALMVEALPQRCYFYPVMVCTPCEQRLLGPKQLESDKPSPPTAPEGTSPLGPL